MTEGNVRKSTHRADGRDPWPIGKDLQIQRLEKRFKQKAAKNAALRRDLSRLQAQVKKLEQQCNPDAKMENVVQKAVCLAFSSLKLTSTLSIGEGEKVVEVFSNTKKVK